MNASSNVVDLNANSLSDQVNRLVAENRRLRLKGEADDATIDLLKRQYDTLQGGVEDMIEDHRKIERDLSAARDRAVVAYTEIDGLLKQAADLIVQAMRARVPAAAPDDGELRRDAAATNRTETRMPQVLLS